MRKLIPTAAALLVAFAAAASAQEWPTRPITLVVPFTPGGPIDVVARVQGQRLSEILGQPIIIENIGGGGGSIGALRTAKAPPDGYQFLVGNIGTHAYNQTLFKRPHYNALTDFTPVALTTESARVLVVRKDLPVNTVAEFAAYAKANQAKMQFGSGGVGSATHIPCVLINLSLGIEVTHIPYRGAGPAMQDVIGGRIDYMCDSIQTAVPQILQGNVKALAVLAPTRAAVLPDVPTSAEAGLKGAEASAWNAIFLPKGTPDPIVRRLNKAVVEMLDSAFVKERMDQLGLVIVPPEQRSPEYLAQYVASEIVRWSAPIKASGVTMD